MSMLFWWGVRSLGCGEPPHGKNIMYHGTSSQAARSILAEGFRRSTDGKLGPGVYLSRDLEKARRYPIGHPDHNKVVIKVAADLGKVITIDSQGPPRQKTWHDPRYGEVFDTAWVPPDSEMTNGLEEHCVLDPNRIKILKVIHPTALGAPNKSERFLAVGVVVVFILALLCSRET